MMDDLIYRNVLIDELKKIKFPCMLPSGAEYLEGVQTAVTRISGVINDAPTVNRLIPCNDRLPDKDGKYLVLQRDQFEILTYNVGLKQFGYTNEGEEETGCPYVEWAEMQDVTHWMPLPEKPSEV